MTPARVSVVVVAHNAMGTLGRVLDAIHAQRPARPREVIVVDDASSDGTAALAEDRGAHVLRSPVNRGQGACRNLGWRAARGDVVVFIDDDCVPQADWLERGSARFDAGDAEILAGHIDVEVRRASPAALLDLTHHFDQERYAEEGFAASGHLWVQRAVAENVGGFDERLTFDEDKDFVERAVAAGARLRYAPDAVVTHPSRTARQLVRRSFRIGRQRGLDAFRSRARAGSYLTAERVRARLERAGYRAGRARLLSIGAAKLVCIRAPIAMGALVGAVKPPRRATPDAEE